MNDPSKLSNNNTTTDDVSTNSHRTVSVDPQQNSGSKANLLLDEDYGATFSKCSNNQTATNEVPTNQLTISDINNLGKDSITVEHADGAVDGAVGDDFQSSAYGTCPSEPSCQNDDTHRAANDGGYLNKGHRGVPEHVYLALQSSVNSNHYEDVSQASSDRSRTENEYSEINM